MLMLDEETKKILKPYEEMRDKFKIELEKSPNGRLLHQMKGNHV